MKAHIGVDADSGLVHTVIGTAANVNDATQCHGLLHGEETVVFANAGYQHYTRVMDCICSSRLHGSPSTKASNCGFVSESEVALSAAQRGYSNPPRLSRRAAHHTSKPSCSSNFMRLALALASKCKRSINHALSAGGELRDACVHVEQRGHMRCRATQRY